MDRWIDLMEFEVFWFVFAAVEIGAVSQELVIILPHVIP